MDTISRKAFMENRPDNLCKRCGKCCTVSTTSRSYDEIKRLANEGYTEAVEFLEIFEPYKSIEEAKKVDADIVNNIGYDENTTFYRCKFLSKNKLCSRYETRKNVCKRFPSSPFAVVPPGCGYTDWLYEEKMKIVNKIRSLKSDKEKYLEELKEDITEHRRELLNKLVVSIDNYIKIFEEYGSNDW